MVEANESDTQRGVLKNAYATFCKTGLGFGVAEDTVKSVDKSLSIDKTKWEERAGENLSPRRRLKYKNQ